MYGQCNQIGLVHNGVIANCDVVVDFIWNFHGPPKGDLRPSKRVLEARLVQQHVLTNKLPKGKMTVMLQIWL
jgi:hypothetical protein